MQGQVWKSGVNGKSLAGAVHGDLLYLMLSWPLSLLRLERRGRDQRIENTPHILFGCEACFLHLERDQQVIWIPVSYFLSSTMMRRS